VTCLEDPGGDRARKLAGLGILPGVDLVLLQRTAGFVFRIGHAEIALDVELATAIRGAQRIGALSPARVVAVDVFILFTDASDASLLVGAGALGLVYGSFVPNLYR
jgi:hypothetical protein